MYCVRLLISLGVKQRYRRSAPVFLKVRLLMKSHQLRLINVTTEAIGRVDQHLKRTGWVGVSKPHHAASVNFAHDKPGPCRLRREGERSQMRRAWCLG